MEHLCQSLFFNKVAGLRPVNFEMFAATNSKKFQEMLSLEN